MTWKRFRHYWPFVRGMHRWPVDFHLKGPVMERLVYSHKLWNKQSICRWFETPKRLCDVTVMTYPNIVSYVDSNRSYRTGRWTGPYKKHMGAHRLQQIQHIYCMMSWILAIISSGNGLSPVRRQAITQSNDGLLSVGPVGTNLIETSIKIQTFALQNMHLNMPSEEWGSFNPDFSV